MVKRLLIPTLICLQACSDQAWRVKNCEEIATGLIKSPATYSFVSGMIDGKSAVVRFDSQNGFGAMIRSSIVCAYNDDNLIEAVMLNGEVVMLKGLYLSKS